MPVPWTPQQAVLVDTLVSSHPPSSGRCVELARAILPIALELDSGARALLLRPKPNRGRFVVPRAGERRWYHHALVDVDDHGVDALTGAEGTPLDVYLSTHWRFPEALALAAHDLTPEAL